MPYKLNVISLKINNFSYVYVAHVKECYLLLECFTQLWKLDKSLADYA